MQLYQWALNLLSDYLNDPEITNNSEQDIQKFFVYLNREYKPNRKNDLTEPLTPLSIENVWTATRSFYNWASSDLGLQTRPDKKIQRPRYRPA